MCRYSGQRCTFGHRMKGQTQAEEGNGPVHSYDTVSVDSITRNISVQHAFPDQQTGWASYTVGKNWDPSLSSPLCFTEMWLCGSIPTRIEYPLQLALPKNKNKKFYCVSTFFCCVIKRGIEYCCFIWILFNTYIVFFILVVIYYFAH